MVGTLARFVIESTFAPPIDGPIKEKNGFLVETSPRFVRPAPNWRPLNMIPPRGIKVYKIAVKLFLFADP